MTHFVVHLKKKDNPGIFIERAAEIVKEGGLIAYPTNTVYGLGADPLNNEAVEQIFSLKNRDREMGLPVLISDFEEGKKVAIFGKYELKLAENFWPGELTIILPLKTAEDSSNNDENTIFLDKIVSGGKNTIALRVPKNPIILGICQEIKKNSKFGGVIGTSANFSGAPNPTNGKVVIEQLSYAVNLIIDTGKCIDKIPSTIVKIDNEILKDGGSLDDAVHILREGKISKEKIIEALQVNGEIE